MTLLKTCLTVRHISRRFLVVFVHNMKLRAKCVIRIDLTTKDRCCTKKARRLTRPF